MAALLALPTFLDRAFGVRQQRAAYAKQVEAADRDVTAVRDLFAQESARLDAEEHLAELKEMIREAVEQACGGGASVGHQFVGEAARLGAL